jgi:hypothetical protein
MIDQLQAIFGRHALGGWCEAAGLGFGAAGLTSHADSLVGGKALLTGMSDGS